MILNHLRWNLSQGSMVGNLKWKCCILVLLGRNNSRTVSAKSYEKSDQKRVMTVMHRVHIR